MKSIAPLPHHREFRALLAQGLVDDGYALDWTTLGSHSRNDRKTSARIVAKAEGVFVGAALARAAAAESESVGLPFAVKALVEDGAKVRPGKQVLEWRGSAAGILVLERPFLNLASYLSGIATQTQTLVARVEAEWRRAKNQGPAPRVTCTRKILPHYREVAIAAVLAGGGSAHRVGLSGGVLIKENHIATAGGIGKAIAGVRKVAPHGMRIETEVRNLSEVKKAIDARADALLLDNFSPAQVREAVDWISESGASPIVECSGGISLTTIASYAQPGVHILSVGGLTHSVTAMDLSLLMT